MRSRYAPAVAKKVRLEDGLQAKALSGRYFTPNYALAGDEDCVSGRVL